MNVLGISCHYHDSAAAVIKDGRVVYAAQEERFNREKNSPCFPIQAINFCLQSCDMTIYDVDYVAFYEKPFLKFQRVILSHLQSYPFSIKNFLDVMPHWLDDRLIVPITLKSELGYKGKVLFIKHHLAHAASAFLASPFDQAAIITSDGIGEWASITTGIGKESEIRVFNELHYPDSLGLLYSAITSYLGFRANRDEGKVMALADYGKAAFLDELKKIIEIKPDGSFNLNESYFGFNRGNTMYSKKLIRVLGEPRDPKEEIEERHYNIAASIQKLTEEILISVAQSLYKQTRINNLCLAGGTFLNCVANSKILEKTPFKKIFIQPAAGDSGGAMGAALYVYNGLLNNPRKFTMKHAYLGPCFPEKNIRNFLLSRNAKFERLDDSVLVRYIAKEISKNKVIGWFQGRMEFGPRALGNRSILANPQDPNMRDFLNNEVKHREWFRPYGISIIAEELSKYFSTKNESPFMLLTGYAKKKKIKGIPSALHVNGTSRIQTVTKESNPIFYKLLKEFKRIMKIPMVINTSFNDKDEPIVCSPEDAYSCFMRMKIDILVLGNFVIEKIGEKDETSK